MASIASGLDRVLKAYFDTFRKNGNLPPFLSGKIPGKLMLDMPKKGWLDFYDPELEAKLGGYLDECIHLDDGKYAVLDHKTRGSAPQEVHRSYQLQMDAYTFLLEQNNLPTNRTAYIVYYIPEKIGSLKEVSFDFILKELKTDPERAEDIFHSAVNTLASAIPEVNKNCDFCKWLDTSGVK